MMYRLAALHVLYVILLLVHIRIVLSGVSSAVGLRKLAVYEKSAVKKIEGVLKLPGVSKRETELLRSYIDFHYTLFSKNQTIDDVIFHPMSVYHFLKNLILYWKMLLDIFKKSGGVIKDLLEDLNWDRDEHRYPNEADFLRVSASIARMQYMYELPVTSLVEGRVHSSQNRSKVFFSAVPLNAWDCLYIGKSIKSYNVSKVAIRWIECAQDLTRRGDQSAKKQDVEEELENTDKVIDDPWLRDNTSKLCRADRLKESRPDSHLFCRYLTRGVAYLKLAPFKVEEISVVPPIMLFHDVLTKMEMERFKELAEPCLTASGVSNAHSKTPIDHFASLSENCWIKPNQDEELHTRVSQRISDATGLDASIHGNSWASENYRVTNYGIGGLQLSHDDSIFNNALDMCSTWLAYAGDRVATFFMYLNDVEAGGGTVFPEADVTISAKAGSALFFYNLYKDGRLDTLTRHAGCPVLYGTKWIALKWMHYNYQHNLKCGLTKDARYDLL